MFHYSTIARGADEGAWTASRKERPPDRTANGPAKPRRGRLRRPPGPRQTGRDRQSEHLRRRQTCTALRYELQAWLSLLFLQNDKLGRLGALLSIVASSALYPRFCSIDILELALR